MACTSRTVDGRVVLCEGWLWRRCPIAEARGDGNVSFTALFNAKVSWEKLYCTVEDGYFCMFEEEVALRLIKDDWQIRRKSTGKPRLFSSGTVVPALDYARIPDLAREKWSMADLEVVDAQPAYSSTPLRFDVRICGNHFAAKADIKAEAERWTRVLQSHLEARKRRSKVTSRMLEATPSDHSHHSISNVLTPVVAPIFEDSAPSTFMMQSTLSPKATAPLAAPQSPSHTYGSSYGLLTNSRHSHLEKTPGTLVKSPSSSGLSGYTRGGHFRQTSSVASRLNTLPDVSDRGSGSMSETDLIAPVSHRVASPNYLAGGTGILSTPSTRNLDILSTPSTRNLGILPTPSTRNRGRDILPSLLGGMGRAVAEIPNVPTV